MSESTYIPTYWYRQLKVFLASKARQSEKEKEREKKAEKCISIYFVPDDSFDLWRDRTFLWKKLFKMIFKSIRHPVIGRRRRNNLLLLSSTLI